MSSNSKKILRQGHEPKPVSLHPPWHPKRIEPAFKAAVSSGGHGQVAGIATLSFLTWGWSAWPLGLPGR